MNTKSGTRLMHTQKPAPRYSLNLLKARQHKRHNDSIAGRNTMQLYGQQLSRLYSDDV